MRQPSWLANGASHFMSIVFMFITIGTLFEFPHGPLRVGSSRMIGVILGVLTHLPPQNTILISA